MLTCRCKDSRKIDDTFPLLPARSSDSSRLTHQHQLIIYIPTL